MLETYKKSYEELANYWIPNWKKLNINDIINLYVENENKNPKLAQAYLGAIFCKYWFYIKYFYYKSCNSKISPEECYNWLVDGILLCLNYRAWLNPANKLYGDPNGPDKAMNICIITYRQAFYQYSNYDCRKLNYEVINTEDILVKLNNINYNKDSSEVNDDRLTKIFNYEEKGYDYVDSSIKNIVVKSFNKGNYFLAFMIDNICRYSEPFRYDSNKNIKRFSKKKLCAYMHNLNSLYIKSFSFTYNIGEPIVVRAIKENISILNTVCIRKNIDKNLEYLKSILTKGDLC